MENIEDMIIKQGLKKHYQVNVNDGKCDVIFLGNYNEVKNPELFSVEYENGYILKVFQYILTENELSKMLILGAYFIKNNELELWYDLKYYNNQLTLDYMNGSTKILKDQNEFIETILMDQAALSLLNKDI